MPLMVPLRSDLNLTPSSRGLSAPASANSGVALAKMVESWADIRMLSGAVAVAEAASVTFTVKLEEPTVVGVPVIAPVEAVRARPGGNAPATMDQEYGGVPPIACSVAEYDALTEPAGSEVVVMLSGLACTVRVVLPTTLPWVARMFEVPALTPVANPDPLIVATVVFNEVQVTCVVR